MILGRAEQLREKVVGMRPAYSEVGNVTELFLQDGQVVEDRRGIKAVIASLARSYAIDLKSQREILRGETGRKNILPFYLDESRIFVPFKMRKRRVTNDMAYGYIDVNYVADPDEIDDNMCRLPLTNGLMIDILSGRATVIQSIDIGKRLLNRGKPAQSERYNEEKVMESVKVLGFLLGDLARQIQNIEQKL